MGHRYLAERKKQEPLLERSSLYYLARTPRQGDTPRAHVFNIVLLNSGGEALSCGRFQPVRLRCSREYRFARRLWVPQRSPVHGDAEARVYSDGVYRTIVKQVISMINLLLLFRLDY
jgi:hypothetical protein